MTFRELQLEVLGWLDEQDDTDVTVERVKAALNQAQRQRCLEQDWPFTLAQPPVYLSLTAGQRTVTLPSDCRRVQRLFNITQGWDYMEVPDPALGHGPLPRAAETGYPRWFYVRGENPRQITWFSPQAADEIELHYFQMPDTMSGDDDLPMLPTAHHDLLVWDALIRMKAYHNDAEAFEAWKSVQREAHEALLWTYGVGAHTVAGQPTYIRYIP
jgi:hypothetical protein